MGLWSWITGVDLAEEQRRSDEADARLKELNNLAWSKGKLTDEELAQRNQRIDAGALNVTDDVSQAFKDGLKEGAGNVAGAVRGTLAAPFKIAWNIIPWQLWVALILYGLWEFGWLQKWLRAK